MKRGSVFGMALCLELTSCARSSIAPRETGTLEAPAMSARAVIDASVPLPTFGDVPDAVRRGDWQRADQILGALPSYEGEPIEQTYLRARVSVERERYDEALTILHDLEPRATDMKVLITQLFRRASPHSSSNEVRLLAAKERARTTSVGDWLEGASLYAKADAKADALEMCRRVLRSAYATMSQQAQARTLRLTLDGGTANEDGRWLYIHAQEPKGAENRWTLTAAEWRQRGEALGQMGRMDAALEALSSAASSTKSDSELYAIERAKAYALYRSRNRYAEAADVLLQLAKGGPHAAEDAFHAARALSRADKDKEALAAYDRAAKEHARTEWGARALYFSGYLRALHVEWALAAVPLRAYLAKYPKGRERLDAERYLALGAYFSGDRPEATRRFDRLAKEVRTREGAEWAKLVAALAAYEGGDREGARVRWQQVLADDPRSYGGAIARARLKEAGIETAPVLAPSTDDLKATPLPERAQRLHALGLDDEAVVWIGVYAAGADDIARCRWFLTLERAPPRPRTNVDEGSGVLPRHAWECFLPRVYASLVQDVETHESLPAGFVHAIMRQESAFDPNAGSKAGAKGLLQLIPGTANRMATELGLAKGDLLQPDYNIRVGAHYLHEMLVRFQGSLPMAAAGYNAGPEAVARWQRRLGRTTIELFVEFVPYDETRAYIRHVMGNCLKYEWLYGANRELVELQLPAPHAP